LPPLHDFGHLVPDLAVLPFEFGLSLHPGAKVLLALHELAVKRLVCQRRVLALAEDTSTPLLERLRFLGIVTSNIDGSFMPRGGSCGCLFGTSPIGPLK
jgi:hypothetical protein